MIFHLECTDQMITQENAGEKLTIVDSDSGERLDIVEGLNVEGAANSESTFTVTLEDANANFAIKLKAIRFSISDLASGISLWIRLPHKDDSEKELTVSMIFDFYL